jgi:selenocysteine lyase/cysteine desulfurase
MADLSAAANLEPPAPTADFPLLGRVVHGRPIVYLDSASSSQHPRSELDASELRGERVARASVLDLVELRNERV